MELGQYFKKAPYIRPALNVGCLMDIPTGFYRIGKHGESILNGGLHRMTGIVGRGNMYKSTLAHFMNLRCFDRYPSAYSLVYDTELTLSMDRLQHLSDQISVNAVQLLEEDPKFLFTDKSRAIGNVWFDQLKNLVGDRLKGAKGPVVTTPFIDDTGEPITVYPPILVEADSVSQMNFDVTQKMFDKHQVGESGLNAEALKEQGAKSQMISQMPQLGARSNMFFILTAHVGDEHTIDAYSPPSRKLSFLKGKNKIKRAPENFTMLPNNLWYTCKDAVLLNDTTKGPEYPLSKDDNIKGDTDLMAITIQNLRAKSGPTGTPFKVVVSQRDGVLVGLTEFLYIKENGRYGLGGHDKSYYLELVPDINLQRTTVRSKINQYPQIRRALEITSELCQIKNFWRHLDSDFVKDPKQLYELLKSKGYDWDILLNHTRGYWVCEEDITPKTPYFLSTMDLLNMCKKEDPYIPWWYDEAVKKLKK